MRGVGMLRGCSLLPLHSPSCRLRWALPLQGDAGASRPSLCFSETLPGEELGDSR